jgi:hypothetical protein
MTYKRSEDAEVDETWEDEEESEVEEWEDLEADEDDEDLWISDENEFDFILIDFSKAFSPEGSLSYGPLMLIDNDYCR